MSIKYDQAPLQTREKNIFESYQSNYQKAIYNQLFIFDIRLFLMGNNFDWRIGNLQSQLNAEKSKNNETQIKLQIAIDQMKQYQQARERFQLQVMAKNAQLSRLSQIQENQRQRLIAQNEQMKNISAINEQTKKQLQKAQQLIALQVKRSVQKQIQLHMIKEQLQTKLKELNEISVKYNEQSGQLRKLKDPRKIAQAQTQLFNNFLNSLGKFDMYLKIPKENNSKFIVIMGEVSAGKTSIYNWLFNKKLPTGAGEVTQQITKIHDIDNYTYFDSPGLNEEIDITNTEFLQAYYCCDYVFIATDCTLKNVKRCLQVMNKINPQKLFLLRTQCDKFSSEQLEVEKKKDQQILRSWGINRLILYISAFKDIHYMDNKRFRQEILSKSQ